MKTAPNAPNAETKERLATLVERANALDAIFACGGTLDLAAPLSLRAAGRKKLEIVEREGLRRTDVDKKLRAWCAPASFGEGAEPRTDARARDGRQLPDKPNSRLQKYRLTAAWRAAVAKTSGE